MDDTQIDQLKETTDSIEAEKKRWKNRRRMAWWALLSMIIFTALLLFTPLCPETRLTIANEIITWYYFAMTAIIGAYMGVTTWAHIKK